MLQNVRKKIIKKAVIKTIICVAIIVGVLVVTKMAPIYLIKGPEKIDIDNIDLDANAGKYVEADITYVYDYFLEEETYTEYKDGSRSAGHTSARYYIIDVNQAQYLALLADGNTLMDEFEKLMDETETAMNNGVAPKAVSYKGSFVKLTSEEYSELKYFMTQVGLSDDMYSDYIFKVDYIGNIEPAYVLMACAAIVLAFLFAAMSLIRGFSGRYVKELKKFAQANGLTLDQLSMELDCAATVKDVWVTARYTAYMKGNKIRILKNEDYIWGYYKETRQTRKGVTTTYRQIALVDRNKKTKLFTIASEDDARKVLGIYSETQPQMVIGYNDDLQNLFRNNFEQFLMLPYANNEAQEENYEQVPVENYEEVAPTDEYPL